MFNTLSKTIIPNSYIIEEKYKPWKMRKKNYQKTQNYWLHNIENEEESPYQAKEKKRKKIKTKRNIAGIWNNFAIDPLNSFLSI